MTPPAEAKSRPAFARARPAGGFRRRRSRPPQRMIVRVMLATALLLVACWTLLILY